MSGNSLTSEALEAAVLEAESQGFAVVRSNDTTLLLDLDSPFAIRQFRRVLPIVQEHFGAGAAQMWLSKSGNTHVLVPLREGLDPLLRFALQAALGSDGVRETLNFTQLLNGCNEPSILFKPNGSKVEDVV